MPVPPSDSSRVRFSTSEVSAHAIIGFQQQVSQLSTKPLYCNSRAALTLVQLDSTD